MLEAKPMASVAGTTWRRMAVVPTARATRCAGRAS